MSLENPQGMSACFLSAAYLPPISYFGIIQWHEQLFIEQYENYQKQSWRNRCQIAGPNKVQILSIPVDKEGKVKVLLKDLKISYTENWQQLHWRSIQAAYNNSPYFQFYRDALEVFFLKKYEFLLDLNLEILLLMLRWLKTDKQVVKTDFFRHHLPEAADYRYAIHPKKMERFVIPAYHQVFSQKFGFIPNLSILDLLCNEGPESTTVLQKITTVAAD